MATISITNLTWDFPTGTTVTMKAQISLNNDETLVTPVIAALAENESDLPTNAIPTNANTAGMFYDESQAKYVSMGLAAPSRAQMKARAYLTYSKVNGSGVQTLSA